MNLALKIDVDSARATREVVPRLVDTLQRHGASATFFFSPDPQGAIGGRRRRTRDLLRHVRDEGFETAVRARSARRWQQRVRRADPQWVEAEMQSAVDHYAEVFGEAPWAHAAAGWCMSAHALRLTQRLGFAYASDGRGTSPHLPVWNGELVRCPQFPTTLPTLPELDRHDAGAVASMLLERTGEAVNDAVFGFCADDDGGRYAAAFEQLIIGWRAQGFRVVAMRTLYESCDPLALPRCNVGWGTVNGCPHAVLVQQHEFLDDNPGTQQP
ncbi:MAG TPA: polysaccharide deacetylase family protein [Casimicrobiaceae bacterium]|nr:polysaccharide deacetylase family protein [Casimicrobiaceae bacterium]